MKKKLISLFLALALVLSAVPAMAAPASAQESPCTLAQAKEEAYGLVTNRYLASLDYADGMFGSTVDPAFVEYMDTLQGYADRAISLAPTAELAKIYGAVGSCLVGGLAFALQGGADFNRRVNNIMDLGENMQNAFDVMVFGRSFSVDAAEALAQFYCALIYAYGYACGGSSDVIASFSEIVYDNLDQYRERAMKRLWNVASEEEFMAYAKGYGIILVYAGMQRANEADYILALNTLFDNVDAAVARYRYSPEKLKALADILWAIPNAAMSGVESSGGDLTYDYAISHIYVQNAVLKALDTVEDRDAPAFMAACDGFISTFVNNERLWNTYSCNGTELEVRADVQTAEQLLLAVAARIAAEPDPAKKMVIGRLCGGELQYKSGFSNSSDYYGVTYFLYPDIDGYYEAQDVQSGASYLTNNSIFDDILYSKEGEYAVADRMEVLDFILKEASVLTDPEAYAYAVESAVPLFYFNGEEPDRDLQTQEMDPEAASIQCFDYYIGLYRNYPRACWEGISILEAAELEAYAIYADEEFATTFSLNTAMSIREMLERLLVLTNGAATEAIRILCETSPDSYGSRGFVAYFVEGEMNTKSREIVQALWSFAMETCKAMTTADAGQCVGLAYLMNQLGSKMTYFTTLDSAAPVLKLTSLLREQILRAKGDAARSVGLLAKSVLDCGLNPMSGSYAIWLAQQFFYTFNQMDKDKVCGFAMAVCQAYENLCNVPVLELETITVYGYFGTWSLLETVSDMIVNSPAACSVYIGRTMVPFLKWFVRQEHMEFTYVSGMFTAAMNELRRLGLKYGYEPDMIYIGEAPGSTVDFVPACDAYAISLTVTNSGEFSHPYKIYTDDYANTFTVPDNYFRFTASPEYAICYTRSFDALTDGLQELAIDQSVCMGTYIVDVDTDVVTFKDPTTGKYLAKSAIDTVVQQYAPYNWTYSGGSVSANGKYIRMDKDGNLVLTNTKTTVTAVNTEIYDHHTPGEYEDGSVVCAVCHKYLGTVEKGSAAAEKTSHKVTAAETAHGTVTVSPATAKEGVTVTVTVKADEGYALESISGTKLTKVNDTTYTFTMPNADVTLTAVFAKPNETGFDDVKTADYFYDAVLWAAKQNVTSGVDATHFAPNATTTRGQMVTFLWRAAGCPEPTAATCPFTDVDSSAYYYKAVLWAVEKGITKGITDTTFAPDATVTRAQAVTFLWRYEGAVQFANMTATGPAPSPYSDVATDAYYYSAVLWAKAQGITDGVDATHFAPNASCTRAQIVTFLYRDFEK